MPLLAGQTVPSPPALPTGPARPTPKRFTWTSAGGDVLDLSDGEGYTCMPGREGFGVVEREVAYDALPDGGGALRSIRDKVRVIALPLRVQGATQEEYTARLRRLQAAMRHPRRSGIEVPGLLTVALPDGSRRSISAYYNGGLSTTEDILDDFLLRMSTFPNFELLALDPYWAGGQMSGGWESSGGGAFFGTMPRQLAASQVLGDVVVDLPGDADSYPIWTITGPGTPTITNVTTGRSFEFSTAVSSGRTVTVDTRPDRLTVVDDLGADLYGSVASFPDFWPLEPGPNELTVELAGSTSASSVSFTADVRWQAGW